MKRSKSEMGRSSLLQVGRRVDYAVRAAAYLAARPVGRIVSSAEIERSQDIPPHFLSKIMRDLVVSGFVESHIGSRGGFSLARPPATITIKDIYEALEGPLTVMECIEHGQVYCWFSSVCSQISVWQRARNLIASYLHTVSISDIADQQGLRKRLTSLKGDASRENKPGK